MKLLSFTNIFALLLGFTIAYVQNYLGNKKRMQELIFIYPPDCYHIHHYITFLLLALMLFIGHKIKNTKILYAVIFLFVGLSLEDLMYGDFLNIKHNCHNLKLIKLLKTEDSN